MSRFGHVLRRLDEELVSPEPWRTRVLLEIAQDLDGAYQAYRERGLSEAEALLKARALLGLDAEAASELGRMHTVAGTSWLLRLVRAQGRGERIVVTTVTIVALAASSWPLIDAELFRTASYAMWLLLAVGGLIVWNATALALALFGGSGAGRGALESRLERLPFLASIAAIGGALSGGVSMARSGSASASNTALRLSDVVREIAGAAEIVTLGLCIALLALLLWFQLYRRVADLRLLRAELDQFTQSEEAP